jgi:hypothetical protein
VLASGLAAQHRLPRPVSQVPSVKTNASDVVSAQLSWLSELIDDGDSKYRRLLAVDSRDPHTAGRSGLALGPELAEERFLVGTTPLVRIGTEVAGSWRYRVDADRVLIDLQDEFADLVSGGHK